jgi:hypothetical protein
MIQSPSGTLRHLEELIVGVFLHLDQVRHFCNFGDVPEIFPNTLATDE